MRAAPVPRILLTGLVALLAADVALAVSFFSNQFVGVDGGWAWGLGAMAVALTFRTLRGWAQAVVEGRLEAFEVRFSGEKIP